MSTHLRHAFRRLLFVLRRSAFERELAEEIEAHRALLERDLVERGAGRNEARRTSSKQMGNITLSKESSRDLWHFRTLESILQDLRHSVRGLLRNPVFTSTAVLSLALGIGANTAIFTAVDSLLFRPLPVRDPARLVTVWATDARGRERNGFPPAFADQLRSSGVFSDVIATVSDGLSFTCGGRAERIMGEAVTSNFFTALGVTPALGQPFSADVRKGTWSAEAVLSWSFWKARFGGDPQVIGRVIRLNTYPFTIVGVSPPSLLDVHQGQDPELRIAALPPGRTIPQLELLSENDFGIMGRLAPGVTQARAQTIAGAALKEFVHNSPSSQFEHGGYSHLRLLSGERGWPELASDYEGPIIVLFLLVVVALLIACANVASMLLARAEARRREFAIRCSLGAGRSRLIRQILSESLLLALFAGLAGLIVARWVGHFLLTFLPQGHIHFVLDLRLDAHSLAFTLMSSIAAGLLFGFTAAVQSTRGDLASGFKTDSNASIGGSSRLRKTLVAFQVAFSLTLLVVAGLFLRTVFNLEPTTEYPRAERTLVFTMKPQHEIYSPERVRSMVAELIGRVSGISGVQAVGIAESGPFASRTYNDTIRAPGRSAVGAATDVVTPGFFRAIGLPLLSGRDFTASDSPESSKVVILSKSLAEALFPNEDSLGRSVELLLPRGSRFFRVVGITADAHYYDIHRVIPAAFFAFQNDPPYMPTLHVRVASSNPAALIPAIRREFDAVDTGFPVFNIRTLDARIQDALARERMIADLSCAFGGLALILATVGLFGVLAWSVARRTREIGVRIALGAKTRGILWLVGREAFMLAGAGVAAGLSVSIAAGELLANRLYGVPAFDPVILITAGAVLLLIAGGAALIPALRACRINPVTALRHE